MKKLGITQRVLAPLRKFRENTWKASPFASNVFLTLTTNVIIAGIGFITGVLSARLLGPQGRGELAAIQIWPTCIATIAMLGQPEALVYFSARNPEKAGQYLGSAMSLTLLSSIPFMAAGFIFMPLLLSAQQEHIIVAARWYLIVVPLFALVGIPYHPLRGRQDFMYWNALRPLPNLGWLVVLCVASVLMVAKPEFLTKVYLVLLSILFIPVIIIVSKRIPGPYKPQPTLWRSLTAFGLPSAASSLPQMLNQRLDQMLIATLLPPHSLGLYAVSVAWGNIISPLLNAVGVVTFPRIAGEQNIGRKAEVLAQTTRLAIFFSLLLGCFLLIITPWVLPLVFGEKFKEAVPVALIMVLAGVFFGINMVLEEGLRGLGCPKAILFAQVLGVLLNIIGLIIMLPKFGIIGAAMASLLGACSITIFLTIWIKKAIRKTISELVLSRWNEIQFIIKNIKVSFANLF